MKDQYFGDQRDYCKFDLVIELATCLCSTPRFTNIVMLTLNDATTQGGRIDYEMGNRDPALYKFLQTHAHLERVERKVRSLRNYLGERKDVEYLPYGDAPPHFDGNSRDEYFANVPDEWLRDAVILADPDIGLCPASGHRTSEKHLLFGEAVGLMGRMGRTSALVVFQWRGQGRSWQSLLDYTEEALRRQNGRGHFDAVHDSSLAFLCLTNDPVTRAKVQDCLQGYAGEHGLSYATR